MIVTVCSLYVFIVQLYSGRLMEDVVNHELWLIVVQAWEHDNEQCREFAIAILRVVATSHHTQTHTITCISTCNEQTLAQHHCSV